MASFMVVVRGEGGVQAEFMVETPAERPLGEAVEGMLRQLGLELGDLTTSNHTNGVAMWAKQAAEFKVQL